MGKYQLYCSGCNTKFEDTLTNLCPICGGNGPLIKAKYEEIQFKPLDLPGFWKFLSWLPCESWNNNFDAGTIVYKSSGLAKELGLKNLYIAFNGYWPEKNANMITCTFKELEAPPTFQRASEKCVDRLVLASAGNTAKAFIFAAQHYDIKLFVVVPYSCKNRLMLPFCVPKNVTIIAVNQDSDYSDSIEFASRMSNELNIVNESGARNIARRDGMGTVMLEGALHLKKLPSHYFQAVGSGTGAIAVTEAAQRLLSADQLAGQLPKLHLSQNLPFTPLVDAWAKHSNLLIPTSNLESSRAIAEVYAKVLTNRHPPYSITGGVFDVLSATDGKMYGITNSEALSAAKMFESSEGIDVVPAASVCVASLIQAVNNESINDDEIILINITGGGEKRLWKDFDIIKYEPNIVCENEIEMSELKSSLEALSGK